MNAVTFDTHAFVKRLKESGFEERQAEALSEGLRESQEAHLKELATKHDIEGLKHDIEGFKHDLEVLKQSIKHDLKELKQSTKHDLKEMEQSTRNDLKELKQSTKNDLKELELKINGQLILLKWMIGILLAGVISLVMKAFII